MELFWPPVLDKIDLGIVYALSLSLSAPSVEHQDPSGALENRPAVTSRTTKTGLFPWPHEAQSAHQYYFVFEVSNEPTVIHFLSFFFFESLSP